MSTLTAFWAFVARSASSASVGIESGQFGRRWVWSSGCGPGGLRATEMRMRGLVFNFKNFIYLIYS